MSANPTRKERKNLKDICLTESSLGIWLEIGGTKKEPRYVEPHIQNNNGEVDHKTT